MLLDLNKDPMGQAISDFWEQKKTSKLWVHSNITDMDEIPVSYLFRNFNQMPLLEQKALNCCKGNILDIGAAAGSHSLWLQSKKNMVTALDISEISVKTMNKRGILNAMACDFFSYTSTEKYNTLLLLMNGIGIAGNLNGLQAFFEKCTQLLASDGQILLDSSDLSYMYDNDEFPLKEYYGEVKYLMKYKKISSDPFNWLFIDFEKLVKEASQHGFTCEKIMNGPHYDYLARLCKK